MQTLEKRGADMQYQERIPVKDFESRMRELNVSPDTVVTITWQEEKILAQCPVSKAFEAILNIKPSQGIRPVVDVVREIREKE